MRYFYPPRAVNSIPPGEHGFLADSGWVAQFKFNDSHALFQYEGPGKYVIHDRHAKRLSFTPSEQLDAELKALYETLDLKGECWLDGGVLDSRHPSLKDTVVIWDILAEDGKNLYNTKYSDRHARLLECVPEGEHCDGVLYFEMFGAPVGKCFSSKVFMPESYGSECWDGMWKTVYAVNEQCPLNAQGKKSPLLEGLMFKSPDGLLKAGFTEKNNSDWMCRSRVQTGRHLF